MEVKSISEVAFEWLCECGAFDQLRKQCECYTADFAVGVWGNAFFSYQSYAWVLISLLDNNNNWTPYK